MVNPIEMANGFWKRHRRLKWTLITSGAGFSVIVSALIILAHRAEPLLRARIVQALENHFHAHVEIDAFHIELRNGLLAEGKGLRIWQPVESAGGTDTEGQEPPAIAKPLIQLGEFRFHTPLKYDSGKPIRIALIQLKGLYIDLPPKQERPYGLLPEVSGDDQAQSAQSTRRLSFKIESVVCTDAHLTLETSKPGKLPMRFDIQRLKLTGIEPDRPIAFQAELINPRPKGLIRSHGNIGPWNVADAGETPVNGDYRFEHVDLSVFKGIAGILNSDGRYSGTLRNITVDGETNTPDFRLDRFGTAVPLNTRFHAIVDGTNGDTQLEPVDALLNHSRFQVRGGVVRATFVENGALISRGHDLNLTMDIEHGNMEDFMRLVSNTGTPILVGTLDLKGKLQIPHGTEAIQDRMKLNGVFSLSNARFTSAKVQDRVSELSLRGQGNPGEARKADSSGVRSTMKGDFRMANGSISLSSLEYTVPGAVINLKGTYGVDGGALDFAGTARMDATVSQMVGGWKGFLLKPVDRLFEKDGAGAQVPIHVRGTRDSPDFGVDLNRLNSTAPQRPDQPH